MQQPKKLFDSFFLGGFECSTHKRPDGKRLDLIVSTLHDKYVTEDYLLLNQHNIFSVRDGIRWHLIEKVPYHYDWSSFIPMLLAANNTGMQVIWDLCHFGYPDNLDIWQPEFIKRFAKYATNVAKIIKNESDNLPFYVPINEISFWSWAGGDAALFNPLESERGFELKHQLVKASIAAIEAILEVDSRARFILTDPLINVVSTDIINQTTAKNYVDSQYQAWDMISGITWPGLGGRKEFLDIIGVNYYTHNQWFLDGKQIMQHQPEYIPFSELLIRVYKRYKRPILISETGIEGLQRVEWLQYICAEVNLALNAQVPIEGICLYPIIDYHGWDDDRHCETGLFGLANGDSTLDISERHRPCYEPLANELLRYHRQFKQLLNLN